MSTRNGSKSAQLPGAMRGRLTIPGACSRGAVGMVTSRMVRFAMVPGLCNGAIAIQIPHSYWVHKPRGIGRVRMVHTSGMAVSDPALEARRAEQRTGTASIRAEFRQELD